MKKFLIFIFILLIYFFTDKYTYADSQIILNEPIIQFKEIKNYTLQGYSVVKDKLFMVLEGYDDTKSIIKVYDLNTYEEVISYNYKSLGHANDVTYNKKTNKIYILASSGSNTIFTFNGNTFDYEDRFEISLPARSITYLDDYNMYAIRTVTSGFIYNKDFILENKLPFVIGMNFSSDLGRQGWSYYNKLIYYANWSWVRLGGDGVNIIYVYDLEGKKIDNLYTADNIGEIEGVSFYNNKMILGFNGYDNTIKFYMTDIPIIEIPTEEKIIQEDVKIVKKKNYNLYIFIIIVSLIVITILVIIFVKHKKK
jgi:hypothetical protein